LELGGGEARRQDRQRDAADERRVQAEGRKVVGRKPHYLVDTEGHRLAVIVHAVDVSDREGARWVFAYVAPRWPELRKVWADQGYTRELGA
jgi:hypothetical protein